MSVLTIPRGQPFSLDQTLGCGQVFRWDRAADGTWNGIVGNSVIRIRQDGRRLIYEGASEKFIREYFSLDMNLVPVLASIDRDPFIHTAIRSCKGLRLIRQPKWECLVSYICSTNSNIPAIRKRIAQGSIHFLNLPLYPAKVATRWTTADSVTVCRMYSGPPAGSMTGNPGRQRYPQCHTMKHGTS